MYKAFYSLSGTPFSKELKVTDALATPPFEEATCCLNYMKQVRGMGLLVGEPGAGKTFALRVFAENLNKSLYKVIYFWPSGLAKSPRRVRSICFVKFNRRLPVPFMTER